ncbi:MAG: DUF1549 and DUF1553 domain-containing protein [Fimbriiglobus sp.]|nr:DUF1549 and DUF1553 domain-containing protein [Fimbriiglobus sp.]
MRSLCLLAALALPALAADPVGTVIDRHIDARLRAESITPAPQADDFTLVRRLTLDLVGRIPTTQETHSYVQSKEPDKRSKLIDRLIASPGFSRYQAYLFEAMLNDGKTGSGLREYLTKALATNKPWDAIFRDLLLPDDADAAKKGAGEFLKPKLSDADKLTNDVSVAFFGVNVSCAQCHDHPNVADWTQDHFYGMKSFLARTYDAGGAIAERASGVVKFKPTKGPERQAKLMFLTGATVNTDTVRELNKDEQKKQKEAEEQAKKDKKAPPPPAFSARAELVKVALQPKESEFFAKSIVNRLWHRFFGIGLVTPLDQMHSANKPSHPELLNELAADVTANKYDLKRLIRGLVMSQAYSRASKYTSESHPELASFAVAQLKPLTPIQLATSLKIAAADPKTFDGKPDEVEKKLEQMEASARGFAGSIAMPTDNFQIGVSEALLFSNSDKVLKEFLTDGNGSLLGRVKAEKDAATAHKLLVRTTLCRPATDTELKALADYAGRRTDRPTDANKQMLWALMTCPEFRFNH